MFYFNKFNNKDLQLVGCGLCNFIILLFFVNIYNR